MPSMLTRFFEHSFRAREEPYIDNYMDNSILIVDDDPGICETLQSFLAGRGYEVDTTGSGHGALEAFKRKGYDVILLDLNLPGMDGSEVLKKIMLIDQEQVVIIMTGFSSLDSAMKTVKSGAYDYLAKPFMLEEISLTIRNACEKIHLREEHKHLVDELRRAYESLATPEPPKSAGSGEMIERLQSLASLFERGLINRVEYNLMKDSFFETVSTAVEGC